MSTLGDIPITKPVLKKVTAGVWTCAETIRPARGGWGATPLDAWHAWYMAQDSVLRWLYDDAFVMQRNQKC